MRLAGLEPAAQGLGTPCSIHLSYRRIISGVSVTDLPEVILRLVLQAVLPILAIDIMNRCRWLRMR